MTEFNELAFHESTVISLAGGRGYFSLVLEDAKQLSKSVDVHIFVKGVDQISLNNSAVHSPGMHYEDGEVLDMNLDQDGLSLLIEWNDFANKTSQTIAYRILGNPLKVEFAVFDRPHTT